MSNTVVTISSCTDWGSDIPKDQTQMSAYIEVQLSDLADDGEPTQPYAQGFFTRVFSTTLNRPNLANVRKEARHGLYNLMVRPRVGIIEGLDLVFIMTYACILTIPTSIHSVDITLKAAYEELFYRSYRWIMVALLYRGMIIVAGWNLAKEHVPIPPVMTYLVFFVVSPMAYMDLIFSWTYLIFCGFIALLGVNLVDYWSSIAGACTLALLLGAVLCWLSLCALASPCVTSDAIES